MEPRCKYWSVAGNSRSPEKTETLRTSELPGLEFLQRQRVHIGKDQRDSLTENLDTSALWTKSPLSDDGSYISNHMHMCPFDDKPDGRRHKKPTRLDSSFKLVRTS